LEAKEELPMSPLIAARVIALVLTGLIAGIFLGHRAGVSRASSRLSPSSFVQLQQVIHGTFAWMMPPLVLGAVLGTLTWTLLLRPRGSVAAFWLLVLASLSLLVAAGLTRLINIPINRQLMTWSIEAPPPDLRQVWGRWERIHSTRTVLVVAAFVCQAIVLGAFT
jgi:uncharacterized membrane protein